MGTKVILTRRTSKMVSDGYREWRDIWRATVAHHSHRYFLSWPWISHWLNCLPAEIDVYLVQMEQEKGQAVCFLVFNKQKRHGIIKSNSFYLHYTGQSLYDSLTLEYNQMPGYGQGLEMLASLIQSLPDTWDELHLPALDATCFPAFSLGEKLYGVNIITKRKNSSHFVDLNKVRSAESYLSLLSANTRSNIRRSRKKLSQQGKLNIEDAHDQSGALSIYSELVDIHQDYWKNRGMPGAFQSNWFYEFHRSLIINRFDSGDIQLLRILCGNEIIGCLYNFVYQGVVHYYQSGFNYKKFRKFNPGLLCHALAIPYNARLGHKTYDFLAGDAQYKKSLSTDANELIWCVIQRSCLRFKIENLAKSFKAWCRVTDHGVHHQLRDKLWRKND